MAPSYEEVIVSVNKQSFIEVLGRPPEHEDEFFKFAHLVRKGVDASCDWDSLTENIRTKFFSEEE